MAQTMKVNVSVSPNEILFPGAQIMVQSDQPIEGESAQSGIVVRSLRGTVTLSKQGTTATWSPNEALVPGTHALQVGNLLGNAGSASDAVSEIPFFVTDSQAQIPPELAVESMVRLVVERLGTRRVPSDRRPEGKFIEIMKAADRSTGMPRALAFDQDGRAIDAEAIFADITRARFEEYGKLNESLHRRLNQEAAGTPVEVAIWLRGPEVSQDRIELTETNQGEVPPQVLEQRQQVAKISQRFASDLAKTGAQGAEPDSLAPVVYARMNADQIQAIAKDDEVLGIFLHERDGIPDLQDSIDIARSEQVHNQGIEGAGIKVAVWEEGPDLTGDLDIEDFFDPAQTNTSAHARLTHAIVKNTEAGLPHGHAPACLLHSANDFGLAALGWAVVQGCTVISQSFHRAAEPHSSTLVFDDIYKDYLALQWPYPTIVQAAGNFWPGDPDGVVPPIDEFVNHKGYNSLAVGNHEDDAGSMAGSSVFRNPSSPHGDRELPEICANGVQVSAVGRNRTGTSYATPAVAGAAALLQESAPILKHWPEGCRAILLAGARRNVAGDTWWEDVRANVDAADGSGALNTLESTEIAKWRRSENSPATRRGWDVGSLSDSDFGADKLSTFSYKVKVPGKTFRPHIKVALAWTSRITMMNFFGIELPIGSRLTVDLDLKIFDSAGVQVGYSGSWDNSYEIAEFTGKPGETYTIKIRRWSGEGSTWFGIAWTVPEV